MVNLQSGRPVYYLPTEGLAKLRNVFNDAKDGLRETFYRWDDRLVREGISLPEDYVCNKVAVVCHLVSRDDTESDGVFAAAVGRGDDEPVVVREMGNGTCRYVLNRKPGESDHAQDGSEDNMFILVVKVVDGVERIIPSFVWLYGAEDEVSDGLRDGLYWSIVQGTYKTILVPMYREVRSLSWSPPKGTYQFVPHVVKSRPEVVEYVPDDRREVGRELAEGDANDTDSVLLIKMDGRTPAVTFKEGINSSMKLADVLIGPFDL